MLLLGMVELTRTSRKAMGNRLIRANEFFSKPWRLMAFQPVLYLFVFGASVRLWTNNSEPPAFKEAIADHFYGIWLFLGISSPILALISWIFIQKLRRRWSFVGMWTRLASDINIFTNLLTYHLVTLDGRTEVMIFNRYVLASTFLFVLSLIVRDIWAIIVMERLATHIHSGES